MAGLGQLGGEVGRWLDTYDRDLDRAWGECRRADWLLRIAIALGVDRRLIVGAACDAAALAVRRTEQADLRAVRCLATANEWARGQSGPAEAWAAAFAAWQSAEELAHDQPLASEAAFASAMAGFACDPRADDHWYAQRAYASGSVEHAVRAFGTERAVGMQRCLAAVREKVTLGVLANAVRCASSRPPMRAF